jgi:hypothetical protein
VFGAAAPEAGQFGVFEQGIGHERKCGRVR